MTTEPLDLSLRGLVALAWTTVLQPREVAERIMMQNYPPPVLWLAFALVVVISVLLGQVTLMLLAQDAPIALPILASPFAMGIVQAVLLVASLYAIFLIGRAMGGEGRLEDILALLVWLQFVMICLQVVQTAAMVILPLLGDLLGLAGLVIFLWLLTNFTAAAHGFRSLALVFVMICVSAFALTFLFSLLLAVLGIGMPGVENA